MLKSLSGFILILITSLVVGCSYQIKPPSTQNVIIVIVDGTRFTETFGGGAINIPYMYNNLKPLGTVYTNFRIAEEGKTTTIPGHSSILTGRWLQIHNDGTERPSAPTIFEYYRKKTNSPITQCYVVCGKEKLKVLSYSTDRAFGKNYSASESCSDTTNNAIYNNMINIMDEFHPKLMIVNFPDTDRSAHDSAWTDYITSLKNADSLVYLLWQKISNDPFYKNNTTMLVTNDHGRHTTDFQSHGDDCDGCEHLMLLAIGKNIPRNVIDTKVHYQIDISTTVGYLMGFTTPKSLGRNLLEEESLIKSIH